MSRSVQQSHGAKSDWGTVTWSQVQPLQSWMLQQLAGTDVVATERPCGSDAGVTPVMHDFLHHIVHPCLQRKQSLGALKGSRVRASDSLGTL